jgi:nucleotide-binding universal stress UspA family protein
VEQPTFQSILHPTDFSPETAPAYVHALRLAAAMRSELHLLHVEQPDDGEKDRFPRAIEYLSAWKMLEPGDSSEAIGSRLGVKIVKSQVNALDVALAIGAYTQSHGCDLLAMTTHRAGWLERLFAGSLAESTARLAHAPALFIREGQRGFVDPASGKVTLRRVLMPVTGEVAPMRAWGLASGMVRLLEPMAEFNLVHVGDTLPTFGNMLPHVELRRGQVVETILDEAEKMGADLIVMATAGHHDIFDELRGSTTEQVLREAPCPVLSVPAKQWRAAATA